MKNLPVSCTVNPTVGFGERRAHAGAGGRVVVVGGGPAGQEAARAAAEDGRDVTLFESQAVLGGRLALAAATGGRDGWRPYLNWLASELSRLGVVVRQETAATPDEVRAEEPDVVILACGSIGHPGIDGALELDAFCAADGAPARVALVDEGAAGPPLWTAALEASMRGAREVTIVTPLPAVCGDLDGATFLALYGDLTRRGVSFLTDHVATAREGDSLTATNIYSGRTATVKADLVVSAAARRPAGDQLLAQLGDVQTITIGDARAPRDAAAAIREGQNALSELAARSKST